MEFKDTKEYALQLDKDDELANYRDMFFIPKQKNGKDVIYFAGNSLGLQPKTAKKYIDQELKDWADLAVEGHMKAKHPWLPYHEYLTEQTARLVGGKSVEVVNMNSLTVNLHLMLVSFYRPISNRYKILIESPSFPSDNYAVQSHIKFHGFEVSNSLIEISPRNGESYIRTEDIIELIEKNGCDISLILLPGVNYYSGQAFDIKEITKAGHNSGCVVGFDLAHGIGNLILNLHECDVDFAVWCSYKYLNGGPGAVAGCYVNEKHTVNNEIPKFLGWWGNDKATRFLMEKKFKPIPGVESWQLSNPPIFQLAALKASLDIFDEIGMKRLRKKSEVLTSYLEFLIEDKTSNITEIITPKDKNHRGCQLSLRFKKNGKEMFNKLLENGVVCDWREPDAIRIAPVPLYNSYNDVYKFVEILKH